MAEIRSMSKIRDKWTRVTPMRSEDYKMGVAAPRRDWAGSAMAQKEVWKAGVTEAATKDSYAKGVERVGTKKWQDRALRKGPGRFAEGVAIGGPDFEAGFAPYQAEIEKTTLPPRFPKGDPRNIERVKVISMALRAKKMAG